MGEIWSIRELVENILSKITDAVTYKSAMLVCVSWREAVGDRVDEFSNHLQTMLELYPEENWNWFRISLHSKIDLNFIRKHPNWSWRISGICANSNFDWKDLSSFLSVECLKMNAQYISANPNLTLFNVLVNIKWIWNWNAIRIYNKNIIDFIRQIPSLVIDVDQLSSFNGNPLLYQIIKELPHLEWNVNNIYYYSKLTLAELMELFGEDKINKILIQDPGKHIPISKIDLRNTSAYYYMSLHKELTEEILDKYSHYSWNWSSIASHPNISIEYLEKKNQYQYILGSPHITWRYVRDNYQKNKNKWDFDQLIYRPNPYLICLY